MKTFPVRVCTEHSMAFESQASAARIGPALPSEQQDALRLLLQHLPAAEREAAVNRAERMLVTGELEPGGLFVARSSGRATGAMLASLAAGAVGLVWPPRDAQDDPAVEDALVAAVRQWLRARQVRTAQALLPREEASLGDSLARNGFPRITTLWFLRHQLELPACELAEPEWPAFQAYASADAPLFEDVLLQTYQGTLDCPELNGVRAVGDILAGHRAQGRFDPATWWLAWDEARPVGVLLLNPSGDGESCELVYMGVVPEHRRQGLGRQLVRKALREAKLAGARELTLAVDERNFLARRLYQSLGFESCDCRDVYLAIFPREHESPADDTPAAT